MPGYDFQVQLEKDAEMVLKNPVDGSDLNRFRIQGHIMKGCAGKEKADLAPPTDAIMARMRDRPDAQFFDTLYSFGDFHSSTLGRSLSMKQNPTLQDSGVEVKDDPELEYPRTQYWSMYAIFTMDLTEFPDPQFRIFHLANRRENPIRLRCRLTKPWGEEIPIRYELIDDEIPLFPWNMRAADFAERCPITGGPAKSLAALRREGDSTTMRGAWTADSGQWFR